MKGYFSSIARQTGLRLPGRGPVVQDAGEFRPGVSRKPLSRIAPIDKEETVLVAPTVEAPVKTTKAGSKQDRSLRTPTLEKQSGKKSTELEDKESEPTARKPVVQSAPEPVREVIDPVSPAEGKHSKSEKDRTKRAPVSKIQEAPPGKIDTIEQTEIKEQQEITVKKQSGRSGPKEDTAHHPREPKRIAEQEYFSNTAEIISGREAKPEEVETILLHEIQEWVAAGEQPSDIDAQIKSAPEEVEIHKVVEGEEPQPGVVRIGHKRSTETVVEEQQNQSPEIEEQSFDLSIGSISVVIEGSDQPPVPAPAPSLPSGTNKQETSNRFSRLKRSFL